MAPAYRPRRPTSTALYTLVRDHLETFLGWARETYDKPLPPYVEDELRSYLRCGVFAHGFVRCRCEACGHDLLVAYSNGCFADTATRDLPYLAINGSVSVESCRTACAGHGYAYAGLQYGSQCFCGSSYGRYGRATDCTMSCNANSSETCGGFWANSVYASGAALTTVTLGSLMNTGQHGQVYPTSTTFLNCSAGVYSGTTGYCKVPITWTTSHWSNMTFDSAQANAVQIEEAELAARHGDAYAFVECNSDNGGTGDYPFVQRPICPSTMSQAQCDTFVANLLCY
jgi:hypothetical protein